MGCNIDLCPSNHHPINAYVFMTALDEQLREHNEKLETKQVQLLEAYAEHDYIGAEILEQDIDKLQKEINIMTTEVKAGKFLD